MILRSVIRPWRPRLIEQVTRPLEPLLAALLEDSAAGVMVVSADGRLVRSNRRLGAMLTKSGAMPIAGGTLLAPGAPAEALFAPADREHVAATLAQAMQDEPPPPLRLRLLGSTPDTAPRVTLSAAPLREGDGEISGIVLRLIDASAEYRLESELAHLQKLQAVAQLAGGVAHDFNNLLAAIAAAADSVLERESCDAVALEDVRQIRRSADRGAALVRQLLAFGRQQPLQPTVVPVNAAIHDLADMLSRLLGEQITLRLDLEEPARSIRVDPTQLDQVLLNLVVNARDAMPDGGALTLRTGHLTLYQPRQVGSETMPPGRYVAVSVEDTGAGIPAAILARVFEPFFTTRRERSGSGLGLSTVHGIVRQSGGFVTLESTVGQGTRARLWLPRHEETDIVSAMPPSPDAAQPPAPRPMVVDGTAALAACPAAAARSVLLVEDEEPIRRLAERALRRAGWAVSAFDSAEAALAGLPQPGDPVASPSVLVSDIILPGADGVALVRAVRAVWPGLPAILVSGYADSALVGDLAGQGVAFLPKPFGLKELIACVERAVA